MDFHITAQEFDHGSPYRPESPLQNRRRGRQELLLVLLRAKQNRVFLRMQVQRQQAVVRRCAQQTGINKAESLNGQAGVCWRGARFSGNIKKLR